MRPALQGLGLQKYVSKGLPEATETHSSDRETEEAAEEKILTHHSECQGPQPVYGDGLQVKQGCVGGS